MQAQERGAWRAAALRYQKVLELEPGWSEAACRLGEVRGAAGELDAALDAWDRAPYNPDCAEAAGRALLAAGRHEAARERLQVLRRLLAHDPRVELLMAQALAPADPDAAAAAVEGFLDRRPPPSADLGPALAAVCEALRTRPERALGLLDRAVAAYPDQAGPLTALRDAFEVEVRAVELMGAGEIPLDAAGRAALDAGRVRFAAGDVQGALGALEALADQASRSPEVWAALADVREAAGDIEGAERAVWLARRLAPLAARHHARHAELLADHFGGRHDGEAAALLRRAVEGAEDPDGLARLAELSARAGQWAPAREAWSRVQARWPEHPQGARAERALADLARVRAIPPELPAVPPPAGVPEAAWLATHRAWVLRERADPTRGDLDRALAELDRALELAPGLPRALTLRAQIHRMRGDPQAAIADLRASLAADRDPETLAGLADLLRATGQLDEAEATLREAAAAGSGVAIFRLALREAQANRWWAAQDRLDDYFAAASSGRVHAEARALQGALRWRIRAFWVACGLGALALALLPTAWWLRRRSGVGIGALLERSPRAYREVARLVSSIRHEVLKHSVSALPGVADALEDGDPGPAAFAAARLYGPDGAIARFHGYLAELEALGRAHGVALNLAWRDPTFGPLIAGFSRLHALERRLPGGGPRVVAELRAVAEILAEEGYRALGGVLDGVCVVRLGPAVFERALEDVLAEPAFRGRARPPWSVEGPADLCVRVFRGDLHDILANLLRNALEASDGGRLGVRLAVEEDPITGLERVEIRVRDDAPRRISTATIRGRYIERGLGLAVDLISRAGGAIHVEDEPGWSKAVVVRLPREDA